MRSIRVLGLILAVDATLLLVGCGGGNAGGAVTTSPDPVVQSGAKLVNDHSCVACHSTTGAAGAGPTWKKLFGSQRQLTNGSTVVVDDAYLHRAIADPDADVPKGYSSGLMSSSLKNQKKLSPQEIDSIVAYLKTLR